MQKLNLIRDQISLFTVILADLLDTLDEIQFVDELFNVPVPCLNLIGSSVYETCGLLECLQRLLGTKVVNKCPIMPGVYGDDKERTMSLPEKLYEIDVLSELSSIFDF